MTIVSIRPEAGTCLRENAEDLYGPERVGSDWNSDSTVRVRTRRLLRKAQARG